LSPFINTLNNTINFQNHPFSLSINILSTLDTNNITNMSNIGQRSSSSGGGGAAASVNAGCDLRESRLTSSSSSTSPVWGSHLSSTSGGVSSSMDGQDDGEGLAVFSWGRGEGEREFWS